MGSGKWRERTDQFCSVDQGIYGHLTLRNLTRPDRGARRPGRGPTALEDGPRGLSRRPRGHGARRSIAVNRAASRQSAPAGALSFSQGGFRKHRQSRSENETALSSVVASPAASTSAAAVEFFRFSTGRRRRAIDE